MLASTLGVDWDHPDWIFEVKFDGVRGMLAFDGESVTITSRRGNAMAVTYPELVGFKSQSKVILDGEIIALDDEGNPSFGRLQTRMNIRSKAGAARSRRKSPCYLRRFRLVVHG